MYVYLIQDVVLLLVVVPADDGGKSVKELHAGAAERLGEYP